MLRPGLVSITFRALSPREIIAACVASKLEGIEWGGDVHARPDDLNNAREVGRMTRDAGLEVAAYGSYWRCDGAPFEPIVEAAIALGAPLIRVWAGKVDALRSMGHDWEDVTEYLTRATELARAANVQVATEFHGGTLTSPAAFQRATLDAKSQWANMRKRCGNRCGAAPTSICKSKKIWPNCARFRRI